MDNEFTRERIELAVQQVLSPDVDIQSKAAGFIESWKQSDDAHDLAFLILKESSHIYAQFYSMLVIKEKVAHKWDVLPEEFRESLKAYLCQSLGTFDPDWHLFTSACDIISLIGVFDWPEQWPNFLSDILSDELQPFVQLSLLDRFTSTVTDGIYVTHTRRAKLLDVMLELAPQINSAVMAGLEEENSVQTAFSVLDTQLKTAALEILIDDGIVPKLIDELLPNPDSRNGAIQCLNTIFIDRYDCFKTVPPYVPHLVRAFVVNLDPDSDFHLPLSTPPSLLLLAEKVLFKHCSFICYLLSGMDPGIDVEGAFTGIPVENLEQTQDDIIVLLKIILLNTPDEKQIDIYWALWRYLLPHLYTPPMSELPISATINELLPVIHESLFGVLPSALSEHTMIDTVARICWCTDISLFPDDIAEFLKARSPSIELCYALGFAESVLEPETLASVWEIQSGPILAELDEAKDPDDVIGLLFVLSHAGAEQLESADFLEKLVQFAMVSLDHDEESVKVEAAHALYYVVKRHTALCVDKCADLPPLLGEKLTEILSQMNMDAAVGIVRVFSCLAGDNDELYELITRPVLDLVEKLGSNDMDTSISDLADFVFTFVTEITPFLPLAYVVVFEEPLLTMLRGVGKSNPFGIIGLEALIRAIATIIACHPEDEVLEPVTDLYTMLASDPSFYYLLFDLIAIVREWHPGLDAIAERIEEDFIVPLVGGSISVDDCTYLFRMVSAFSLNDFNIDAMSRLLAFGLRYAMSTVSILAAKCARGVIRGFTTPACVDTLIPLASDLIPAVVESLTDGVHTTATGPLIHLLFDVFVKSSEFEVTESICSALIESLDACCTEPEAGVFQALAENLVACIPDERQFRHLVCDLLVVLRSATPCDLAAFDTVVGPKICVSDAFTKICSSVARNIETRQEDEDFAIQGLKDFTLD